MKEFLLIFRIDYDKVPTDSPEKLQAMAKNRQDWLGSIAAQDKLSEAGERLVPTGKIRKPDDVVTDGPYVELKEAVSGYTVIKAADIEEATELVKDCPIFNAGGSIEIRPIMNG